MDESAVIQVLRALSDSSIPVCIDGGWGVDALLGEQTRKHADLDLILDIRHATSATAVLRGLGFHVRPGGSATNFVLEHDQLGEVDMHCIPFDDAGFGRFPLPGGRAWPFPPHAFTSTGTIGALEVRCLSADAQVQCHGQGYEPSEADLADMERLQARFGVVLPLALCRESRTRPSRATQRELAPDGPLRGPQVK